MTRTIRQKKERQRKEEVKAIADDSGVTNREAAIIQAGGFVETVIE